MSSRADLIETAAKTLFELDGGTFPQDCTVPDDYRRDAAAVLDVVLPQITTAEQRDALPIGTVVWSNAGTIACRFDHKRGVLFGDERAFAWDVLALPLTVLWHDQEPTDA